MWNIDVGDVVKMTVMRDDGKVKELEATVKCNHSKLPTDHWAHSDKVTMETCPPNSRVSMDVTLWDDGSMKVSPSTNTHRKATIKDIKLVSEADS